MSVAHRLAFALTVAMLPAAAQQSAPHAMVVSASALGSDAGLSILRQGGNAIDAAVATGFALAVTIPQVGNLGGGGFMLIRMHDGTTHFLDFREKAPAAATADMYLDAAGNVIPGASTLGYRAIGVPGSVAGLTYAQAHFGKLSLAQDMAPAIALAEKGFLVTAEQARTLRETKLARFPATSHTFQRDGKFYQPGEMFVQPELAATLKRIAADPTDFYRGALAHQLASDIQKHGGLLTEADLAAYTVADRRPLTGSFSTHGKTAADTRTYDILTSPPSSSGGMVLLEALNILDDPAIYPLWAHAGDRSSTQVHYLTEAFRRAYMDRSDYLGDPAFNQMPLAKMASREYAAAWAKSILPAAPSPSAELRRPAGFLPPPPAVQPHKESTETTHFSIVDPQGNAVAMTYTLNGYFGCGATAEGLGFVLNNEMDDFSSKPGAPNMFGLVQGPANAVGPGHRPLSSMTPTIVTTHARPGHPARLLLVLGSPGGSTISTTVINDFISILVNGLSVQAAADAPRFHHQFLPDRLDLEKAFPAEIAKALAAMGYKINQAQAADEKNPGTWGDSEIIMVDPETGALEAGHDHRRVDGKAAFY